ITTVPTFKLATNCKTAPTAKTGRCAISRNWKWLSLGCLLLLSLGIVGLLYRNTPTVRSDFWASRAVTFNSSLPQIQMPTIAPRSIPGSFFTKLTREERAGLSKGALPCEDGGLVMDAAHLELEEEQVGDPKE